MAREKANKHNATDQHHTAAEPSPDEAALNEVHAQQSDALEGLAKATSSLVFVNEDQGFRQSGTPQERSLLLGGEDPRDTELVEQIMAEKSVYSGLIFDVSRLDVRLPDGRMAQRDVVRHPGAVAVVALTDNGKICLVRQWRSALGRVTLEIPAGKLSPGEDPRDCAIRELLEETGMQASKMAYLSTIASSDGFTDELIHLYMATGLSFVASNPDDDEFINVDLVELNDLIDAVLDGRIEDVKTVVGALICDAVAHRLAPTNEA